MKSLIILTGKTAAGKDAIKLALISKYPGLKKVITDTPRIPRTGEINGVDYNFLTKEQFKKKIEAGDFAEYVEYGGNLYGTSKKELEQAINGNTLWIIDPSRAGEVREFIRRTFPAGVAGQLIKKVVVIYVTVSDEIVLKRLKERHLSDQEIEKRMADDKKIWDKYRGNYDFVVENIPGKLDGTVDKIVSILENHSASSAVNFARV